MTQSKTLIIPIVFLTFAFSSCHNVVYTEPQPVRTSAETAFPEAWQGLFRSADLPGEDRPGSAWVKVTEKQVVLYNSRVDSVPFLEGDYDPGSKPEIGDSVQVMLKGQMVDAMYLEEDWARYEVTSINTLGISDSMILKLGPGWGFLNIPDEQHGKLYWNGLVIEPLRNGDLLLWSTEDGKKEAEKMKSFFQVEELIDSGYAGEVLLARPKQKEFIAYIESGGYPDLFMWLSKAYEYVDIPQELK